MISDGLTALGVAVLLGPVGAELFAQGKHSDLELIAIKISGVAR